MITNTLYVILFYYIWNVTYYIYTCVCDSVCVCVVKRKKKKGELHYASIPKKGSKPSTAMMYHVNALISDEGQLISKN